MKQLSSKTYTCNTGSSDYLKDLWNPVHSTNKIEETVQFSNKICEIFQFTRKTYKTDQFTEKIYETD